MTLDSKSRRRVRRPFNKRLLNMLLAGSVACCAGFPAGECAAAELEGTVVRVEGDRITVDIEGELAPEPGDRLTVSYHHPALGPLRVGEWQVTAVEGRKVTARLMEATGEPGTGMAAVIEAPNPAPIAAAAALQGEVR
ncbi:MAG: hypothetical protein ACE5ED_07575, partial [Rhodothalassiaceae bacterium]